MVLFKFKLFLILVACPLLVVARDSWAGPLAGDVGRSKRADL